MPLIKCPECHKKISSETEKRIHCGAPITREYAENAEATPAHGFIKPKWLTRKLIIVTSAAIGALVVICCAIIIPRQITINRFKDDICKSLSYHYESNQTDAYIFFQNSVEIINAYKAVPNQQWLNEYSEMFKNDEYIVVYHISNNYMTNPPILSGYYVSAIRYDGSSYLNWSGIGNISYDSIDSAVESLDINSANIPGAVFQYKKII